MFAGEFHKLIDVLEHTSQDAGPSFIYEPIKVLKCLFAVCDRIVWDSCPLIQLGRQLVLVHGCLHALEEELPFFLISLEAHQTYSVSLKTIGGQDYRDLDAQ